MLAKFLKYNNFFLSNIVISGQIWLDHKIGFFNTPHFRHSDSTGNDLIWQKMDIKFWKYGKFTYSLIEKMASKPGPKQNGYGKHAESPV